MISVGIRVSVTIAAGMSPKIKREKHNHIKLVWKVRDFISFDCFTPIGPFTGDQISPSPQTTLNLHKHVSQCGESRTLQTSPCQFCVVSDTGRKTSSTSEVLLLRAMRLHVQSCVHSYYNNNVTPATRQLGIRAARVTLTIPRLNITGLQYVS